ncbi:N-acetylmuramoyl-L-alanine amidase family protein [Clostridium uliginosum]|uniref:Putative cell wall binding repeat-containing protein n=1 Tax=Clostridium uliginosum TaxID=119641 RepID=A0A1I1P035_9CLOT|nr:N-acetylmuramoyl-L-alanine amidase family protein [Clostridium uliginosum]SFD03167.1 Putative cell wall binding repeat-containing protein [Clostridium uliginosum]
MKKVGRKLLTSMLVAIMIATIYPIKASAEWRFTSNGYWKYAESDSIVTGWKFINSNWYYFDDNGIMKTDWQKINNELYLLNEDGEMTVGPCWVNRFGTWYYLGSNGAMKTGWLNEKGIWYYFNESCVMQTGWILNGGKWYFIDASGAMKTGLTEIDNKKYYFDQSGAMQTGNVIINGETYTFASSGEQITSVNNKSTEDSNLIFKSKLGFSMKFPSEWKDRYTIIEDDNSVSVYFKSTDPNTPSKSGLFFVIMKKNNSLDESMYDSINGKKYITIDNTTYFIGGPTDISLNPENTDFNVFISMNNQCKDVIDTIR